jgi:peptide/nickel transport system substrate-binding protein
MILAFSPSCSTREDNPMELRYGFTTEPSSLDPLSRTNTADGRSILFNVFEGLVRPDTEGQLLPCIAETWTVEQDALVYLFTLRDGIYFLDGSLLTPADVKFTLDTAKELELTGFSSIEEVTTPNDRQVKVVLNTPDPEFLTTMTLGIVKAGNNDRENNVIGTGPFFIESYTIQQNLVLRRFENYWQRLLPEPKNIPHLKKVTIVFFANNDAALLALQGGSIDGLNVTGSMAAQLDQRQFDIFHNYSASVQLMALNNAAAPFDDIRIRKAIIQGIDIQNVIDTAFFGMGSPSPSPIIPGLSLYYDDSSAFVYNPDAARALLAEAGFDTNRLSFEITVPSNYSMHVDTAQVIVNQLERIGVDAGIRLVDWATWLSDTYRSRNYQATIISLDGRTVSPRSYLARYYSGNSGNFMNFSNEEFERVFDAVLTETDETRRIYLYKEAQRIILSNAASVFLQDIYFFMAFRGGIFAGILNYPLYVIDFSSIYRIVNN